MVAVGGLGNVYGAVVGTVGMLYLEHKLRVLGTHETLLGWDLPPQRRRSSRWASSASILIPVMLFFPHGLLPALLDSLRSRRQRWTRPPGGAD